MCQSEYAERKNMKRDARLFNSTLFIATTNLIAITSGVFAAQHYVGEYYSQCERVTNNDILTVCTILFAIFAIFHSNVPPASINQKSTWAYRMLVLFSKTINLFIYSLYIVLVDIMYKNIKITRQQDDNMIFGTLYAFLILMSLVEIYKHVVNNLGAHNNK
jgi:hypothetical protein